MSGSVDVDAGTAGQPIKMGGSVLSEGRITPEGVAKMRALVRQELRRTFILNTEFTRDAVRHYCWGIGDANPLWWEPEHAAASDYGRPVAPQGLLYTTHPTYVQVGLPGVHGLHAGTQWQFFAPIPIGTVPKVVCWLDELEERESSFAGNSVWVYFKTVYADQDDRVLGVARSWSIRNERAQSRKRGKLASRTMKKWELDEIEPVEDQILAHERQGAEPRYWDDVQIGDSLLPLLKGPLCATDMIAWYLGSQPVFAPAHEIALRHYKKHENWAWRNPELGVLEPNIRVHENIAAARSSGLPAPYDVGIQRHQWIFQALGDWAGDAAVVKACEAQFRAMNYFGDLTTITGEVTEKYVDDEGDHVVRVQLRGTNQLDEVSMPGSAVVALPTKDGQRPVKSLDERVVHLDDYLASVAPDLVRLADTTHA